MHTGALGAGPSGDGFRADLEQVVLTALTEDSTKLRIETWRADSGLRRVERA